MNSEATFFNNGEYSLDPNLTRIINFQSATCSKAAEYYCENNTIKEWLITWIEGAIHKYADAVVLKTITSPCARHENHELRA
jgi:hypothetical protein